MAESVKQQFKVDGMSCAGCAGTVERVVGALPGVRSVAVSLDRGTADVEFDPATTPAEGIVSAIASAGFEAAVAAR